MDLPDHAEQKPETISVARCRDLLGGEARNISDEEVDAIRRHASAMAHTLVDVFLHQEARE